MNCCLSYKQQGSSSLTVRGAFLAASASPSKVSPAAWQHGCGADKLFSCHQPFPGAMQGKAGTDRASVNLNGPYCPELALTMHQGEACD